MRIRILVVAALLMLQTVAMAETRYVTDKIEIMLREGKGMEHKIIGVARSNDPVEVLTIEGEYAQIRLGSGLEGWVLARYLSPAIPKPMVIANLSNEIEQTREKLKNAQQELVRLGDEKKTLEASQSALEKKVQELTAENKDIRAGCADFIALREDHAKLSAELKNARTTLSDLSAENEELRENTRLMWFIFGSAAVLSGFIIGMYLQSLRLRRRRQINF